MIKNTFIFIFLFATLVLLVPINAKTFNINSTCPEQCKISECLAPDGECLAGLVKNCCCYVCGRREGERCWDSDFEDKLPNDYKRYSECGDNLACRLRTDLEPNDKPEAICYCLDTEPICGSDGITYENECQFTEARYKNRDGLFKVDNQRCKSKPKIISSPRDTTNNTGSLAAFSCEAEGWPVPSIEWLVEQDSIETPIKADNFHFQIKTNQSTENAIISWLQVIETKKDDSGIYICLASNSEGSDQASAYLTIGNFQKKFDLNLE